MPRFSLVNSGFSLKNLPTTWGLRLEGIGTQVHTANPLKNLPTTWGLRPFRASANAAIAISKKPPHHMGIKTC